MRSGILYIMCAHLLLPNYLYAMEEASPRNSPQSRIRRLNSAQVLERQNEKSSPRVGNNRRVPTLNMAAVESIVSPREQGSLIGIEGSQTSDRGTLTPRSKERAQTPRTKEGTTILASHAPAESDSQALALIIKFKDIDARYKAAKNNLPSLNQRLDNIRKLKEYIKNAEEDIRSIGLELTEKEKSTVKAEKYALKYFILRYEKKQSVIREKLENAYHIFLW